MHYHFKNKMFLLLGMFIGLFSQCGYYSVSGSLPPHLKTVAVPLFDDQTAEFGLKEELTDALIEQFTKDNSLRITEQRSADVLVEGVISSVYDQAGGYDKQETVAEMQVYCRVNVKCTDQVKRKVMWEESISRWGRFTPNDPDSRREGLSDALKQIAEEIITKTVSGW
jgi:hypothetical protein